MDGVGLSWAKLPSFLPVSRMSRAGMLPWKPHHWLCLSGNRRHGYRHCRLRRQWVENSFPSLSLPRPGPKLEASPGSPGLDQPCHRDTEDSLLCFTGSFPRSCHTAFIYFFLSCMLSHPPRGLSLETDMESLWPVRSPQLMAFSTGPRWSWGELGQAGPVAPMHHARPLAGSSRCSGVGIMIGIRFAL